ncbi:putative signal transduction protein p25, partial [Operophtera brumata]
MGEEEAATLDGQFYEFSRLLDRKKDGTLISLYCSDYWMRQAQIIDDRKNLDEEKTKENLTNCGIPGSAQVTVPSYRDYFLTYKPKEKNLLK